MSRVSIKSLAAKNTTANSGETPLSVGATEKHLSILPRSAGVPPAGVFTRRAARSGRDGRLSRDSEPESRYYRVELHDCESFEDCGSRD